MKQKSTSVLETPCTRSQVLLGDGYNILKKGLSKNGVLHRRHAL